MSSSVEAEFNNLKNRVFSNKLPMRIDRFVLEHLDYLDGWIKDASNPRDLFSQEKSLVAVDVTAMTPSSLKKDYTTQKSNESPATEMNSQLNASSDNNAKSKSP